MVLHAFLLVWRIRDHVGGDLTAPIENNLHGAITVLLLLVTAASLEPALPTWQLPPYGGLFSVPGGASTRWLGIPRPVSPRAAGLEGRAAGAMGDQRGRGLEPLSLARPARAEPQGRSRPAPSAGGPRAAGLAGSGANHAAGRGGTRAAAPWR